MSTIPAIFQLDSTGPRVHCDPRAITSMNTNVATTKGLPSSTRCIFLSQEVRDFGTCEVTGLNPVTNVLTVRLTVDGSPSYYYPGIKTLLDTYEGDRVLVEVSKGKWEPRIVDIDDAVDTAPDSVVTSTSIAVKAFASTQRARVFADFAVLYNNALDEGAYNRVRVALNDSSDEATDDGSIDVDMWQVLTSHCEAFENVQDTWLNLQTTLVATRATVSEQKG